MKRRLQILIDELRRLKAEGVTTVSVSEETIEKLRGRVGTAVTPERRRVRGDEEAARELAASLRRKDLPEPVKKRAKVSVLPPPPKVELVSGTKREQLEALREQVLGCPICAGPEGSGRRVVFGSGDPDAELFFVNDVPGVEEEESGDPFAGEAGELLGKMIGAMGIEPEKVYLANLLNWRPVLASGIGSRAPTEEEIAFCRPYLEAQISIVRPKVLIALGDRVIRSFFGRDPKRPLRDIRGEWREFQGVPTMLTYNPGYLTKNQSIKIRREVWEDLLEVMERVGLPISDRQRRFFLSKRE